MFGLFKSKEQKSIEKFWKSDIGERLTAHNEQYFGLGGVWENFSLEGKQELCGWLLQRIFGVYKAPDAFLAMRLELAAMVNCHAELVILLKNPVNDGDRFRYVSGDLYPHIRSCATHCRELAEKLWRTPDASDADLYEYARQRSIYYNYVLNGINQLRYDFDDFDDFAGGKDRDWLRPFSKSMMIWNEDLYRSKIGLPTLFQDKIIKALPHSDFFTLVHNGVRNPLFEWEAKFGSHENAC